MAIRVGLVAATISIVVANSTGYDDYTRSIVYVLTAGIFVTALSNMVVSTLQGLQRMKVLALSSIVNKVGYAALAIMFLVFGGGALWVAVSWVVMGLVVLAINGFVL